MAFALQLESATTAVSGSVSNTAIEPKSVQNWCKVKSVILHMSRSFPTRHMTGNTVRFSIKSTKTAWNSGKHST